MKVFDIENPVWSTFSKILDIMILNVLFLLCCVPVVTISTSFTALYFTAMRVVSGNVTYVSRDFWNSFKSNFKQAFVTGVIVFDAGVILAVGTYLSFISNAYVGKVFFVALDFLFAAVVSYVFPSLAKFECSTGKLFYNSVVMAFVHIPFAIFNLRIFVLVRIFAYMNLSVRLLMLVCGFAVIALLQSLWFNYIFEKYMTKEELELNQTFRTEEKMAAREKKENEKKIRR